jgi:hypothetical protein
VERELELVSATARPGATFTLQITAASSNYDPQRTSGMVEFTSIKATLPVVDPRRTVARDAAPLALGKLRVRGRRATVPLVLKGGVPISDVVVTVRGRGGRAAGTRRVGRLGKSRNAVLRLRRGAAGPFAASATARRSDGSLIRVSRKRR